MVSLLLIEDKECWSDAAENLRKAENFEPQKEAE